MFEQNCGPFRIINEKKNETKFAVVVKSKPSDSKFLCLIMNTGNAGVEFVISDLNLSQR